jgi:uncharacterized protein (TIGR00251 family)
VSTGSNIESTLPGVLAGHGAIVGVETAARPARATIGAQEATMESPQPQAGSLDSVVTAARDGVVVNVHVQPRAGRAGIAGRHGDALRVRVKAPPVGGRANDEVIALVARALQVPRQAVTLATGATSRVKRFHVAGLDVALVKERLTRATEPGGA